MFIATIVSIVLYNKRMEEASQLMAEAKYNSYDSYVVMITSGEDEDFWNQVYESAKTSGQKEGVYVDMFSEIVDDSFSKDEYIEMAIESDCDAIFVEGDDTEETAALLQRATKTGISVFTMGTDVNEEYRNAYIGANSYTIANMYGSALLSKLDKQKTVMILGGNQAQADSFATNIQTVMDKMTLPNGTLKFETRVVDSKEVFATEEYVQNLFLENDLASVVICLDGELTESFYQAMIDYNKVGQILFFGNNKTATILTGIKQGVISGTVYIDAESLGQNLTEAYIEYRDSGYVSDYINVDATAVDSSNVSQQLQEVDND